MSDDDQHAQVMGVLNVTPDSFSDGGLFTDIDQAIERAKKLIRNGSNIVDVGGESSRPGAGIVSVEEEIRRVIPVVSALKAYIGDGATRISVDTRNAETMRLAIDAGAHIINDISALTHDERAVEVISDTECTIILMHMQGTPQTMQDNPSYRDVIDDIYRFFEERLAFCARHNIDKNRIILDPGIGFGKTLDHNLLILRYIKEFQALGCPVMLGTSRKSFIGQISQNEPADQRLGGSLSSVIWGYAQGVRFFRVHDVQETRQALDVYARICKSEQTT